MGVLNSSGAVGYIFRVSPHSSQVISLINPLSSLPARSQSSRITGLVSAGPKGLLLFDYLDKALSEEKDNKYLKTGDKIVTLQSDQFPAGLPVGQILSIDYTAKDLNPTVYAQPAVQFRSLEELFVVLSHSGKSLPPLSHGAKNNEFKD